MENFKFSYNLIVSGKEENIKKLWVAFNNMDYYKKLYKKEFNYFFGLRSSWFALIWLYWVDNASNEEYRETAVSVFNRQLKDKKFHRVHFSKMGDIYPYNPLFCMRESYKTSIIRVNIYEEDKEYCIKRIREMLKLFGLQMNVQQYKNQGNINI